MRNQYGRELRRLVGEEFALDVCVTMHDVDAFEEQVSAYPAVHAPGTNAWSAGRNRHRDRSRQGLHHP